MTGNAPRSEFAPRCLSIDLEVGREDGRIHQFAGVRGDCDALVAFRQGDLNLALARLDALADGAAFVLGHNLIAFDLPHLQAAAPGLKLLELPAVDTLRMNPLAFPRHPYHHLVKHYLDGQLKRERRNDPELDARLTLEVFRDQRAAFLALHESNPDLLTAWHWLATVEEGRSGLNAFFTAVRGQARPGAARALVAIGRLLEGVACVTHARWVLLEAEANAWPLAYALAWLSVAGGNSVMPPWVRHQFPAAGRLVQRLRDTPCGDPACAWCSERHDAVKELQRWFRLPGFRLSPDGRPLQQQIVEAAMRGEHVLGILPTGTGKSLCYQVPALSRYDKTGALTVVISPLVALMADQVKGLEERGISAAVAVNGLLSLPERAAALDRVRLGDAGILIISPEQLRSVSVRRALKQREIGAWVLDEAHCLSKWGHDFRPDYRYVGRFIKESAVADAIPPILCLTATAKPEVVADIQAYFRDKVGAALSLFDGGSTRNNLDFRVIPTTPAEKPAHIHQVLLDALPDGQSGGAIVYAATRKNAEDYAKALRQMGIAAEHFHAGLSPELKKDVQKRFVDGDLRVITATNAFGMGIDKPDVRLVIHADIPGSLENYLQEAGRAGRDRDQARCVLLYTARDVERQFGLSARSRLTRREIQAVLKAVRQLDRKKHQSGEVIATPGEILAEEEGAFERDSTSDDTRVKTALSWLEEAQLLTREENRVSVFPSSLRVASLEEAQTRLGKTKFPIDYQRKLLNIIDALLGADADEGISTDELMGLAGLSPEKTRHALHDLESLGIASNDTALTAFVHRGVERSSEKRLAEAAELEQALIALLREAAPDLAPGGESVLHLRHATQRLKDAGHARVLPEQVWRLVKGLAGDGQSEGGGGSLAARKLDPETVRITLLRAWNSLEKTARLRREGAARLLQHLLACLPEGQRGSDLLAETTLGKLLQALNADLALQATVQHPQRLLDRALLWLHEQEIIRLNKGLAVFRPAMTLRLERDRRPFVNADFEPLKLHYDEQVFQVHVMAEYAARGLEASWNRSRVAVIAREWDDLVPIRAWCEAHGIPVESAQETAPPFWRLRETRALVTWLRLDSSPPPGEREHDLAHPQTAGQPSRPSPESWLDTQPAGPWWDLLRVAVAEYRLETGGADLPPGHLLEWLAEWGHEVRRRRNGLLLTSAHRAKGLEFDHVVVLDGNWNGRGAGEDADAARRLYYVAMTRARQTLTLARRNGPQPLLALPALPCLLRRSASALPEATPDQEHRYRRVYQGLTLKEVDIGYAGRQSSKATIHAAINALQPGDMLTIYLAGKAICDARGIQVGQLAKGYKPPAGLRCVHAQVAAIVVWERSPTDAEYQSRLKCDAWEVVLPELVFAPD